MLYLKRKSDGKEFPVYQNTLYMVSGKKKIDCYDIEYTITLPSDEYELIFKPPYFLK